MVFFNGIPLIDSLGKEILVKMCVNFNKIVL